MNFIIFMLLYISTTIASFITFISFLSAFWFLFKREESLDNLFISFFVLFEAITYGILSFSYVANGLGVGPEIQIFAQQSASAIAGISTLFLFLFSLSTLDIRGRIAFIIPSVLIGIYIFFLCYLPWQVVEIAPLLFKGVCENLMIVTSFTRLPLALFAVCMFFFQSYGTKARFGRVRSSILGFGILFLVIFAIIFAAPGLYPILIPVWRIIIAISAIIIYLGFAMPDWLIKRFGL